MATKKIVPRATNEGAIGTAAKVWGNSYFMDLYLGLTSATTIRQIISAGVTNQANGARLALYGGNTTGSNNAGGYLDLYPGLGTGNAVGTASGVAIWSGYINASATGQQSYIKNTLFYSMSALMGHRTYNPVDPNDYFDTQVGAAGATTLTTVDSAASAAHLVGNIDGNITWSASSGVYWKGGGAATGNITQSGLTINTIDTDAALTSFLVETGGLVKKRPLSGIPSALTTVTDTNDTTCWVGLWPDASGNLAAHTDEEITYNATTNRLYIPNIRGNEVSATAAGTTLNIEAGYGAGTDQDGGKLQLRTGTGTGNAGPEDFAMEFYGGRHGGSGTTAHTHVKMMDMYTAGYGAACGTQINFYEPNMADYLRIHLGSTGTSIITYDATSSDVHPLWIEPDGYLGLGPTTHEIRLGELGNNTDFKIMRAAGGGVAGSHLTISGADCSSGLTNSGGGNLIMEGGIGTGSAAPGVFLWYGGRIGSSGTTAHINTGLMGLNSFGGGTDITNLRLYSALDANDLFNIYLGASGSTTLSTTDSGGTAGHLTLDADGDIELNAESGQIQFKDNTALNAELDVNGQFSSLNYRTIYIDAGSMIPSMTNGAATGAYEFPSNDVVADYYGFDSSTDEYAQFKLVMPAEWDASTGFKAKFYWLPKSSTTTTHDVTWGIQATSHADGGTIDSAWGTPQVINDSVLGTAFGRVHISSATPSVTVAGSPVDHADEFVFFRVYRDISADDLNEDARLLGVMIQYQEVITHDAAW